MNYVIRGVKVGDEEILANIQTTSWKNAFKDIVSAEKLEKVTEINQATNMYKNLLEDKVGNGYILEVEAVPHCIAWWDSTRDETMEGYAELICIHSLPNNWNKGYGTKMIEKVLQDMRIAGFEKVMLWVFVDNIRARKFYEALGFIETEKIVPAFETTEICYIKEL